MNNFRMLMDKWTFFSALGKQAEDNIYHNPNVLHIKIQQFTETICRLKNTKDGNIDTQFDVVKKLESQGLLGGIEV